MAPPRHLWPTVMGVALWFTTGWESFYWLGFGSSKPLAPRDEVWLVAFVAFGLVQAVQLSLRPRAKQPSADEAMLIAAQSAAALTMAAFPCYFGPYLVAYVAWQVGLAFSPRIALSFAAIQGLGFAAIALATQRGSISVIGSNLAFQLLAVSTAAIANREARSHAKLRLVNAELARAKDQLAEKTIAAERGRIAREIHDVLGHHLAALSLQLEVASHKTTGEGHGAVARAQCLASSLLGDVRLVVDAYRSGAPIDVRAAIEKLLCELEHPRPHLTVVGAIQLDAPVLAHTLIRCVQELVTNVLKHAHADNLWVRIERTKDGLSAQVRDDGAGCDELRPGYGLSGVRERLAQVGGALVIERPSTGGVVMTATLPLASPT